MLDPKFNIGAPIDSFLHPQFKGSRRERRYKNFQGNCTISTFGAVLTPKNDLDGILISVPESIYWLTGMDHWGFFAAHVLILNRNGEMGLACRALEQITFDNQVKNARFYGHKDHEELSDYVLRAMSDLGLKGGRVRIEKRSLFLTPRHAERIQAGDSEAEWIDASGIIDDLRQGAPICPAVMAALIACNTGVETAYGADRHIERLNSVYSEVFERDTFVFAVPTGTAGIENSYGGRMVCEQNVNGQATICNGLITIGQAG